MEAETFDAMKKKMTTLRKQITRATNSLTTIVNSSGSRRSAKALVVHLDDLILKTSILQTEIAAMEDEHEAERQESLHLTYVSKCDDIIAAAQSYLASREGEAGSVINLRNEPIDPPEPNPFLPIRPPSGVDRRVACPATCWTSTPNSLGSTFLKCLLSYANGMLIFLNKCTMEFVVFYN
jgi:hypothetical protein